MASQRRKRKLFMTLYVSSTKFSLSVLSLKYSAQLFQGFVPGGFGPPGPMMNGMHGPGVSSLFYFLLLIYASG